MIKAIITLVIVGTLFFGAACFFLGQNLMYADIVAMYMKYDSFLPMVTKLYDNEIERERNNPTKKPALEKAEIKQSTKD